MRLEGVVLLAAHTARSQAYLQAMLAAAKPGSTGVPIRARFVYYIVKSSLTNLLR